MISFRVCTSPTPTLVPVFAQGLESASSASTVQRRWRPVDVSSVKWLETCRVEVDADECAAPSSGTDPVVEFLKRATKVMSQTGGAIPSIVDNALDRDGWEVELERLVQQDLDENMMQRCLGRDLNGKLIRIVGSRGGWPQFVSSTAEGSAKWSLEASEFQSARQGPDMNRAELYIFVKDFQLIKTYIADEKDFSPKLLGRLRVFIHELIHGIRFLRSLLLCPVTLVWSRNSYDDWCVEESVFRRHIATPPRLGPAPQGAAATFGYPADAGRAWEHSITHGKAFFQNHCQVVVCFGGNFKAQELSVPEACAVLDEPRKLIKISRDLAGRIVAPAGAAVVLYATVSDTVAAFEYQCSGSARWLVDNLAEYYSRKAASTPSEHQGSASIC